MPISVGGFLPTTTVDYPGKLAAVVFTNGCPWNCYYCHNRHLLNSGISQISWQEVVATLEKRKNLLDGVVFSGGEPTLQKGLLLAFDQIKDMELEIALHSGGGLPEIFKETIKHCDWVGMDIKADIDDYEQITQTQNSGESAYQSLNYLLDSGVEYEIRTTIDSNFFTNDKIISMATNLKKLGVKHYTLQIARKENRELYNIKKDDDICRKLEEMFETFTLR